MPSSHRLLLSATAIVAALTATSAFAQAAPAPEPAQEPAAAPQPGLASDIIVTAQRRAEKQVDVPITITNVSAQQLSDASVNALSDVARVAPAVRFDNSAAFAQPSIRGVGTAVTSAGGGANVGIYIDGFYSPNPLAADFQLMNISSIQVLKGPQGTLFGRNTTGGAILVSTADPNMDKMSALAKVTYGRYNAQRYQGYFTTPLMNGLAFDVEGLYAQGDGYTHNIAKTSTGANIQVPGMDPDPNKIGAYRNWSLRFGLKAELSDRVSVLLRYAHTEQNDPTSLMSNIFSGYIGAPNLQNGVGTPQPASLYTTTPNDVYINEPAFFFSGTNTFQGTIKADLGFADLTSYTQYKKEDSLIVEDLDSTGATLLTGGLNLHIGVADRTFSQEVLLSSKPGGKLQWTVGAFYFSTKDTWTIFIGFPTTANPLATFSQLGRSSQTTEGIAGFADATYEITPRLFITAGGRFSHDIVKDSFYTNGGYPNLGFPPNIIGDKFTPRAVIRFKPTEQSSIYASFTKGYKAAINDVGNTDPTIPANGRKVQPEDITAYEVGYKFDNRVFSADLSAYYYDYKNLQVSVFKGTAQAQILNAANSRIYGVEGQVHYRMSSHFELNAGAAWTHGRYVNFPVAPVFQLANPVPPGTTGTSHGPLIPTSTPLMDVNMQRVPEFTGNVGARYVTDLADGKLALSSTFYYSGSFFYGPSGTQFKQNGYGLLGARVEWTDPSSKYSIAVFGDNITNTHYRTQVLANGFGIGATWNQPASWGVQLAAKF